MQHTFPYSLEEVLSKLDGQACQPIIDQLKTYTSIQDLIDNAPVNSRDWYVHWWTTNMGNASDLINLVGDNAYAYWWAIKHGDRELMSKKINTPYWAMRWAQDIGDHDLMKEVVKGSSLVLKWNDEFPDFPI